MGRVISIWLWLGSTTSTGKVPSSYLLISRAVGEGPEKESNPDVSCEFMFLFEELVYPSSSWGFVLKSLCDTLSVFKRLTRKYFPGWMNLPMATLQDLPTSYQSEAFLKRLAPLDGGRMQPRKNQVLNSKDAWSPTNNTPTTSFPKCPAKSTPEELPISSHLERLEASPSLKEVEA